FLLTCYFYSIYAIFITYGEDTEWPRATRTSDHGHPLSPRARDGDRSDGGAVGRPELLHRPDAAARARRQRPRAPRRGRPALRLHAGDPALGRAQVGAAAHGGHVL